MTSVDPLSQDDGGRHAGSEHGRDVLGDGGERHQRLFRLGKRLRDALKYVRLGAAARSPPVQGGFRSFLICHVIHVFASFESRCL